MQPIKFLETEIAERIEKIASKFINQNPIEKIINLKRIVTELEHEYFDKETTDTIKDIIDNHSEQLLLHFATYDPTSKSHASFVTPISDEIDCITTVRKNQSGGPSAVFSYLLRHSV